MKNRTVAVAVLLCTILIVLSCTRATVQPYNDLFGSVNLAHIENGIWDCDQEKVMVAVQVKDHKIIAIDYLKKEPGSAAGKAHAIRLDEKRLFGADAIRSQEIADQEVLEAIELALKKGMV